MLGRYLEKRYSLAELDEQAAFRRLLEFEDTTLMRHLMGEDYHAPYGLEKVIAEIRHLPV
jgi:succinate dehydrogenase flavin-adding protein (antitoxin of CptAB toxin-antitoxin module)